MFGRALLCVILLHYLLVSVVYSTLNSDFIKELTEVCEVVNESFSELHVF